ncbi:MAG TPA: DUF4126 family protein [Alloacidobacterium sp.]|nr:DUF4126 family protein [Alloacidobacterium sp.]
MLLIFAFLIGIIAGLRSMMAPAVVSWAAGFGWIHVEGTPLSFMAHPVTRWIFALAAVGELVNDKLPKTPSRKIPPIFITRIVTGALAGATIGASQHSLAGGLIAGALGAVAGTLGGASFRGMLARAIGKDFPAALIEDVIAIVGGILIVTHL